MAEIVQEKSRGLKFAEQQLLRHGWERGKGLGRAETGISEAIKVKVKCDKGGVGHKEGEQFTFHWWDHVFNKSSSSLQVESDENGIKVRKTPEEDGGDGTISNKRPRKAALAKAKLYGRFVKSATLLSGHEQPQPKSSSSDDSSSSDEDDDHRLDLSSATKLSDADLVKACGGRTAHKGARHGLTMSAKLARLEQQEAEFMAKYGKKGQSPSRSVVCAEPAPPTIKSAERQEETAEDTHKKKKKKKRRKEEEEEDKEESAQSVNELNGSEASESTEADVEPKKKKKKKKKKEEEEDDNNDDVCTEDIVHIEDQEADCSHQTTRKEKRKNKAEQKEESPTAETAELTPDTKMKKRKRKKGHNEEDTVPSQSELDQNNAPKTRGGDVSMEESEDEEEESTENHKRTKCKKEKSFVDVKGNKEAPPPPPPPPPPKKKKKKKKKKSKV